MNTYKELIEAKRRTYKYFNEKDSLAAVQQDGYALRFVKDVPQEVKELTLTEVSELLGYEIKIIK